MTSAGVLFLLGCYLYGAVPFVWLLARWRGVDLRAVGSGNVGGGNLWQMAGPGPGLMGGLLDISKGALPVVAGRLAGFEPWPIVLGGVAAVIGQAWPVFLKFQGGRSNSVGLGLGLALAPKMFALALVMPLGGLLLYSLPHLRQSRLPWRQRLRLLRSRSKVVPVAMLLYFVLLPVLSLALGEPREFAWGLGLVLAVIVVRRVTAEWRQDWSRSGNRASSLWNRLMFDRGDGDGGARGHDVPT